MWRPFVQTMCKHLKNLRKQKEDVQKITNHNSEFQTQKEIEGLREEIESLKEQKKQDEETIQGLQADNESLRELTNIRFGPELTLWTPKIRRDVAVKVNFIRKTKDFCLNIKMHQCWMRVLVAMVKFI